jgi:hypothetical protein
MMNCAGSVLLPRAENASQWADAGHDEHAEIADQHTAGTLPDWIARLIPAGARSELALAFDVATRQGRVIGENIGRAYGDVAPFEVVGSADMVGVDGDAVVVLDWKTGYLDVEPAATNPQMAFYALAACRAFGKDRAIVRLVYTKSNRVDEAELDALDLAAFADRLESLFRRVALAQSNRAAGAAVDTREGSWCRYCPSKAVCPSKVGLLAQIAAGGLATTTGEMTPAVAARAYEQLVRIEQIVKEARARLLTFVEEQGSIDLGNGRAFGRYRAIGDRKIDVDKAEAVVRDMLGPEAARAMIKRSTSQDAIKAAAKQYGKRGDQANVIKLLEAAGAIQRAETFPIGEYATDRHDAAAFADAAAEANRALEAGQ